MSHEVLPHHNNIDSDNPWINLSESNLPTTSPDRICQFYLREIQRLGKMEDVEGFIEGRKSIVPRQYDSAEEFESDNPNYASNLNMSLDAEQKLDIRTYSGYRFAWLNSVARGIWDYEKLGRKTLELEAEIKATNDAIDKAITNAPAIRKDILTFRGTNLDAFRRYGVNELVDLTKMSGQFFFENGFTSTALLRERSFADREVDDLWIGRSNIEIRYHIPGGTHDAVALLSNDLSYNPEQTEVLINRNSLNYIYNVEVAGDHAVIDMLLIPHALYELQ